MPGEAITKTETKGERKRTTVTKQIPVIAQTWWKKLLHFFGWALNRLLFFRDTHFYFCSGMTHEFLFSNRIICTLLDIKK